jgi:hypothetical protein
VPPSTTIVFAGARCPRGPAPARPRLSAKDVVAGGTSAPAASDQQGQCQYLCDYALAPRVCLRRTCSRTKRAHPRSPRPFPHSHRALAGHLLNTLPKASTSVQPSGSGGARHARPLAEAQCPAAAPSPLTDSPPHRAAPADFAGRPTARDERCLCCGGDGRLRLHRRAHRQGLPGAGLQRQRLRVRQRIPPPRLPPPASTARGAAPPHLLPLAPARPALDRIDTIVRVFVCLADGTRTIRRMSSSRPWARSCPAT